MKRVGRCAGERRRDDDRGDVAHQTKRIQIDLAPAAHYENDDDETRKIREMTIVTVARNGFVTTIKESQCIIVITVVIMASIKTLFLSRETPATR